METQLFEGIEPDPSIETVFRGAEAMRAFEPDVIVAIGGGSPIDAAKAMWVFYEHPEKTFEDIKDPETGKTKVRKVNTGSIHYQIARGLMMRLEPGDLDDPGLANAYRMDLKEFKQHYRYLFEDGAKVAKKQEKK